MKAEFPHTKAGHHVGAWVALLTSIIGAAAIVAAAVINTDAKHDREASAAMLASKDYRIAELQRQVQQLQANPGSAELVRQISVLRSEIAAKDAKLDQLRAGAREASEQDAEIENSQVQVPQGESGQVFETETYRAIISGIRRQGSAVKLSILFENLTESPLGVYWLGAYLLDDNGEKWPLQGHDSGGFVQEHGFLGRGGVNVPAGTKIKSDFLFSSPSSGSRAVRFSLISTEGSPVGRRPVSIRNVYLN